MLLRFVARLTRILQQALPLVRRLPFSRDVAADADDSNRIPVGVCDDSAALGDPHQMPVWSDETEVRFIGAARRGASNGTFDGRFIVGVNARHHSQLGPERSLWKSEQRLRIGRPRCLT